MAPPELDAASAGELETLLNDACNGKPNAIPAIVLQVVNAQGESLFTHATGKTLPAGSAPDTPLRDVKVDDVFPLWSSTKLVTTIATMQLVERGLIGLDDATIIEKHLPELTSAKVFVGWEDTTVPEGSPRIPKLENRKPDHEITARRLLTHTAGTGYNAFNRVIHEVNNWDPTNGEAGDMWGFLNRIPLIAQLGTVWDYGCGLEWLGVLIERLTGEHLSVYFDREIFTPLGISSAKWLYQFDELDMARLVNPYMRGPDENFVALPAEILSVRNPEDGFPNGPTYNSLGGTGLVMSVPDFCIILSKLLNKGTCVATGKEMLTPNSVAEMSKPQLPPEMDIGVVDNAAGMSLQVDYKVYDPKLNQGFGGLVVEQDRAGGRKAGSYF